MNQYIRVPYGCTVHGQEEINAVVEVLKTSTQMGKNVAELESRIAKDFDKPYGIMVNSGSSALYLAVETLNLPPQSEIITPALTFATTVASIVKNGHVPSFVDVKPGTYCIDVDKIEQMITDKTAAVSIPNLLGNISQWDRIKEICDKHRLKIIEDSADTLGAKLNGKSSGFCSDISITSFYGSHVINGAGNGGMLCVSTQEQNDKARLLRSWGRSSSLHNDAESIESRLNVDVDGIEYDAKFVFESIGYQLEPSEMSAAFALEQYKKLSKNIELRRKHFQEQLSFFSNYKDWFILPQETKGSYTGWLAFPLTVKENAPFSRKEMQIFLEKRNIQTRTVMTGNIMRQPGFRNIVKKTTAEGYKVADQVMIGGILLACHHGLTDEMLEHVHDSCRTFFNSY